jgi:outer membrane immunogenic protein
MDNEFYFAKGAMMMSHRMMPAPAAALLAAALLVPGMTEAQGLTGFHVGILGGYTDGTYQSEVSPGIDHEPSGGLIVVQAGWDRHVGALIIGIDGDIAFAPVDGGDSITVSGFKSDVSSDLDYIGTLRGRVGGMAGPGMIYGTAGIAVAEVNNKLVVSSGGLEVGRDNETSRHKGWTAGAGVKYPMTLRLSFEAQYLYIDMHDEEVTMSIGTFPFTDEGDLNMSTFRVGVSFHL